MLEIDHSGGGMAERTRYEPGTFCWVGLATSDPAGAKAFYKVASSDDAARKAERAGGRGLVAPMEVSIGRLAVLLDPPGRRVRGPRGPDGPLSETTERRGHAVAEWPNRAPGHSIALAGPPVQPDGALSLRVHS